MTKFECKDTEPFQADLKFNKPGPKKKTIKRLKSRTVRRLDPPKDTYCRFCGQSDDETAYYHHCEVPYLKLKYGKGVGQKIDDNLTVWGHHRCGEAYSEKPVDPVDSPEFAEWCMIWYLAIIETHLID